MLSFTINAEVRRMSYKTGEEIVLYHFCKYNKSGLPLARSKVRCCFITRQLRDNDF